MKKNLELSSLLQDVKFTGEYSQRILLMVQSSDDEVHASGYHLIAADLRDLEALQTKLVQNGVDFS